MTKLFLALFLTIALPLPARAAPLWSEYHDFTAADHQGKFNALMPQGYRMISLSVYGDASNPRYAAVWVKRAGPAWAAAHNMSTALFQQNFDKYSKMGYRLVLVTATGPSSNPLFAAVWEKSPDGHIPVSRINLVKANAQVPATDPNTIDYWLNFARQAGNRDIKEAKNRVTESIPSTLAVYGSSNDPRYAIVLEPNPTRIGWSADLGYPAVDVSADYQKRVNAEVSGFYRPVTTTLTSDFHYWGFFRDDAIGPWVARHDLTRATLDAEIAAWKAKGYFPISIQGGGVTGNTRYTALFAQNEEVVQPVFTPTGAPSTPLVDKVIRDFMTANGLHHAGLGVVKDNKLIIAKGYTLAAPGFPLAGPQTYFRQASVSKVLTAMMIQKLIQDGKILNEDVTLNSILGWKSKNGSEPWDANFNKITIRQLLQHMSGLKKDWNPTSFEIAEALKKTTAIGNGDIKEYLLTRTVTSAKPGVKSQYSNIGYWLLARVIEKLTNLTYIEAVRANITKPLGANRIRLAYDLVQYQPADEARYFDANAGVAWSQLDISKNTWVPMPYSGDFLSLWDGSGGLSLAPADLAKVIANLNVTKNNLTLNATSVSSILKNSYGFDFSTGSHAVKGGYLSGLQSMANFTAGGLTYVVMWSRNEVDMGVDAWYPEFPELTTAINATTIPAGTDLFPTNGIPKF